MGSCVSSSERKGRGRGRGESSSSPFATVSVISVNGELWEYPIPCTVSRVLSSIQGHQSSVLCNSDSLYYGEIIPAMEDGDQCLIPSQIYFVIPKTSKFLQKPLSASDMAALAVKASLALGSSKSKKASRISPIMVTDTDDSNSSNINKHRNLSSVNDKNFSPAISPSGGSGSGSGSDLSSGGRLLLRRYSSVRRARLAVRSFRLRLTTIYEASVF